MMSPNQWRMTALPPVGGPVRSVAENVVDLLAAAYELDAQDVARCDLLNGRKASVSPGSTTKNDGGS
jgi:hypothetical protein